VSSEVYLGMRGADLADKPYARYWNPDMQPPQAQVREAVIHGAEASELGFSMAQADQLLEPGYLPLETGVTTLADGRLFVAALTAMPEVHGRMFEWWMGWHYMEAQRYKLWHPRAHLANGSADMRGDDLDLSDREKYMTTHNVTEYVGDRLERIRITFLPPETVFNNLDAMSEDVTALVYGRVDLQSAAVTIGHLVHQVRQVPGGAEMRSRFWLGKPQFIGVGPKTLRNRVMGSKWVQQKLAPATLGRDMLVHCGMEMNHLASFLPSLYRDYH
jgi:hypothetical protein